MPNQLEAQQLEPVLVMHNRQEVLLQEQEQVMLFHKEALQLVQV
jgi:hypothetical protein